MTQETTEPVFISGIPPELGFTPTEEPYKPEVIVNSDQEAIALAKRKAGMELLARVSADAVEAARQDNASKNLN